jgi:DNA-binding response OmpR family regulator
MTQEQPNSKKIFLIEEVEDEAPLREAVRDKLVREGFKVILAKNGEEGLASALRERPDLILLDIVMPAMDGMTMMKKLRLANEWGKAVPVIFLTNLSANDDKINQAITDYEPAYYILKANLSLEDLIEKIKERLSRPA